MTVRLSPLLINRRLPSLATVGRWLTRGTYKSALCSTEHGQEPSPLMLATRRGHAADADAAPPSFTVSLPLLLLRFSGTSTPFPFFADLLLLLLLRSSGTSIFPFLADPLANGTSVTLPRPLTVHARTGPCR